MKVNWKNYVDHIYIITCTKYLDRVQELYNELSRADIDVNDKNFVTVVENIDTPFYDVLKKSFKYHEKHENPKSLFISTLMHYYCMKLAVAHGYNKIAIMEDDVRFLNNTEMIDDLLNKSSMIFTNNENNIPRILLCNSTMYSQVFSNIEDVSANPQIPFYYIEHFKYILRSSGCNIYNIPAMQYFINFIESFHFAPSDTYEQIYNQSVQIYCLTKPICLQAEWYRIMYNTFADYNMIYPSDEVLEEIRKSKPFGYRDGEKIYESIIKYKK